MKILTWNINGIRAASCRRERSLKNLLDSLEADIICLQETKVSRDMLDEETAIVDGYNAYFSFSKLKTGYSGVATFCRSDTIPINAEEGLSPILTQIPSIGCYGNNSDFAIEELEALDSEGRAILTEHKLPNGKSVVIINVYCPRADKENEERVAYKMKFYKLLQERAETLVKSGRHVIILGDINTAHKMIDHCEPEEHKVFNAHPGRQWLNQLLVPNEGVVSRDMLRDSSDVADELQETGGLFIDTFRYFYPTQTDAFTNWCTVTSARLTNYGTRIDYIFADEGLVINEFTDCVILADIEGSDHCPVVATLKTCFKPALKPPSLCTKYMPEFAGTQQNLKLYFLNQANQAELIKHNASSSNSLYQENHAVKKISKSETLSSIKDGRLSVKRAAVFREKRDFKRPKNTRKTNPNGKNGNLLSFFSRPSECCDAETLIEEACASPAFSTMPPGDEDRCQLNGSSLTSDPQIFNASDSSASGFLVGGLCDRLSNSSLKKRHKAEVAQWRNILRGPPPAPLCRGHGEPCVLRTVKIRGPNQGKQFFCCARPQGHSSNREARCNFFQWVK